MLVRHSEQLRIIGRLSEAILLVSFLSVYPLSTKASNKIKVLELSFPKDARKDHGFLIWKCKLI